MNSNLLQQHAAFKRQAASANSSSSSPSASSSKSRSEPSKKRFKPDLKSVSQNPNTFKWLKLSVDKLRKRYQKERKPISVEDLIKAVRLDLDPHEKMWLANALKENVKVEYDRERDKFAFKPAYPIHNKVDLLTILRDHYETGMGGILESDVKECLMRHEEIMTEIKEEGLLRTIRRSDKQNVLFYRDTSVEAPMEAQFQEMWNSVSVREISEQDIENYLRRVGISTMEGFNKKKAATKKKPAKRRRNVRMLNSHLDSKMLKEFD